MKAFVMKVDTAQSITQWYWRTQSSRYNEPLRPDLTEAEHIIVNYLPVDRGHPPRTINHEGRNAEQWCWEEARNEPRSRKLPQRDSEEEAQTEPQPKCQW